MAPAGGIRAPPGTCCSELSHFSVWNAIKMCRQWVPLWIQLSLQFSTDCFETLQMFSTWNEDVHVVFGIILWLFFFTFSALWTWSLFFFTWNAIKVYRQWVPCGHNSSYSFPPIVLKLCRCFLHEIKMCMWFWYNTLVICFSLFLLCGLSFWYNTLIIFFHFFCFVNLVSFFFYMKCYKSV